ncbi:hypothetical protein GCM10009696_09840 [Kocuria himachalensis]
MPGVIRLISPPFAPVSPPEASPPSSVLVHALRASAETASTDRVAAPWNLLFMDLSFPREVAGRRRLHGVVPGARPAGECASV